MKTLPEFNHLDREEYNNLMEIIGGYRVEPGLIHLKKRFKKNINYGIECGTGGNPELLKIMTGSPFLCLCVPFHPDENLSSRGVDTGYDAQAMVTDTLWMYNIKFALILEGSSFDYYFYIPVSEQGCLDFGMQSKSKLGGKIWYMDTTDVVSNKAITPVMYQLNLNAIEQIKYARAAALCDARWDAFDRKHGFIRDENDLACHKDGTRVSAEEMAEIMDWDYIAGDTPGWIDFWKNLDNQYMDKWGDIYDTPKQNYPVKNDRRTLKRTTGQNQIEYKTTVTGRPFGDWTAAEKEKEHMEI